MTNLGYCIADRPFRSIPRISLFCGMMLSVIVPAQQATAAKLVTIHAFTGNFLVGKPDGEYPEAGLTLDRATGDMYGTTFGAVGGPGALGKNCGKSCGNQEKVSGNQVTADFFFQGGADGAFPTGEVAVVDNKGTTPTIYSTTEFGGGTACGGLGCGTAFVFNESGTYTTFKFCNDPYFPACPGGAFPHAGPILDSKGNVYGTTMLGGTGQGLQCDNNFGGCGTVYMLSPDLKTESVLYSFCIQSQCKDGAVPLGGLVRDAAGDLYGTTQFGGDFGSGTIFELQFSNGKYTYRVLYSFCQNNVSGCPDGSVPESGLFLYTTGNLYGTASAGGGGNCAGSSPGCGVVFRIAPDGSNYTKLHVFAGVRDGALPQAPVLIDPATGNLFGTTQKGGHGQYCFDPPTGCGTVFMVQPNGNEAVLHRFGHINPRTDGAQPEGALLLYKGYLYGAARVEGASGAGCNCGTLFKINVPTHTATGLGHAQRTDSSFR